MAKKSQVDQLKKEIRTYRKSFSSLIYLKKDLYKPMIEDKKAFIMALDFEDNLNNALIYNEKHSSNSYLYSYILFRRFIETYVIKSYIDKLDDVSFRIFKLLLLDREIGKKEEIKYKKQLKIHQKYSLKKIMENNELYFLAGATPDGSVDIFDLLNNLNNKELTKIHTLLSIMSHQYFVYSTTFTKEDWKIINKLYDDLDKSFTNLLNLKKPTDYSNNKYISTKDFETEIDPDENIKNNRNFFQNNIEDLYKNCDSPRKNFYIDYFIFLRSFISTLWSNYYFNEIYSPIIKFKEFIEKIAPLYHLLSDDKKYIRYDLYINISLKLFKKLYLKNEDLNLKKEFDIYTKNIKPFSYVDFVAKSKANPSFVIYDKILNFSNSFQNLLEEMDVKNKDEIISLYNLSNELSHSKLLTVKVTYEKLIKYNKIMFNFIDELINSSISSIRKNDDNLIITTTLSSFEFLFKDIIDFTRKELEKCEKFYEQIFIEHNVR